MMRFLQLLLNFLYYLFRLIISLIIKCGPVPSHVAFIMDGNRRWAEEHKLQKSKGHHFGYQKLEEVRRNI